MIFYKNHKVISGALFVYTVILTTFMWLLYCINNNVESLSQNHNPVTGPCEKSKILSFSSS